MNDTEKTDSIVEPKRGRGFLPFETGAIVLSLVWIGVSAVFFMTRSAEEAGGDQMLRTTMVFLAVAVPVALIGAAAMAARSIRVMREETRRLSVAIDAIRLAYVSQGQRASANADSAVMRKLDELVAGQRKTETALMTFASIRSAGQPESLHPRPSRSDLEDAQAPLPLDTPEMALPGLSREDFIRAMNFPDTPEDREGFGALRRAMKDRPSALLIQAAQDMLTLLSQDGIYMDDLRPETTTPEMWRAFAKGERGETVKALGAIHDRSSLALASGRMRQDPVFRDTTHHFLRRFDQAISEFAESASDDELTTMSETRSARGFMLMGRVTGIFE